MMEHLGLIDILAERTMEIVENEVERVLTSILGKERFEIEKKKRFKLYQLVEHLDRVYIYLDDESEDGRLVASINIPTSEQLLNYKSS